MNMHRRLVLKYYINV